MICHTISTNEGENPGYDAPMPKKRKRREGTLRRWLLCFGETPRIGHGIGVNKDLYGFGIVLRYGMKNYSRRRRNPVDDMDAYVKKCVDLVATMATAHTPEKHDEGDFQMDDVLKPLLDAPLKQLREFATKFAAALEADMRIPYLVWRPFSEILLKTVTEKATKENVIVLKTTLAREIAEAVEKDIAPQLIPALVGALEWRSAETLTQVKNAVASGEKPKLEGRQSCLFLVAGGKRVML